MLAKQIKSNFIRIACSVRDAFFPLRCQACGFFLDKEILGQKSDPGISDVLCERCALDLKNPESPMCMICGRSLNSGEADRRCGDCLTSPPYYDMVRSVYYYEGPARRIVHAMKYDGVIRLAGFMGNAICGLMDKDRLGGASVIIPVPLHPKKMRKRGYNQAGLISGVMEQILINSGHEDVFRDDDVLKRVIDTRSQAGLHKKERAENVKNAFAVNRQNSVSGMGVILVDDVFTTGATVSACARMLKKAGAARVDVLTFARVRD